MVSNKQKIVKLGSRQYINIDFKENAKRILIIGNTKNMFGQYIFLKEANQYDFDCDNMAEEAYKALDYFIDQSCNKTRIDIIGNADTIKYYSMLFNCLLDIGAIKNNEFKCVRTKEIKNDNEYLAFMDKIKEQNIDYDFIIQNPPYNGNFHLEFLKKGLEILKKDSGKMTIIEPATWLINIRKTGKAKLYDEIKALLKGHVSKIIIENYNKEFNTGLYVPFAITYIDFSKEFKNIEFHCCGETKIVDSLYNCNLVGDYNVIWSILNKVLSYGDMMKDHIYDDKASKKEDMWYCKYSDLLGNGGCSISDSHNGLSYESNAMYSTTINGDIFTPFIAPCYTTKFNEISNKILKSIKRGSTIGQLSDKIANCLTDTREHLENWKYFVFNNKLPLFLNICLTINQNNNSKAFIPWLVDRRYTDEEINNMFGFTDEEIAFIDKTIKKFERYSPWFKRYVCGKDSASNEEVQKFIDSL